jgi:HSP20 family molecular chaperone IbpA
MIVNIKKLIPWGWNGDLNKFSKDLYDLERSLYPFGRTLDIPEHCNSKSIKVFSKDDVLTAKITKKKSKPNEIKQNKINQQ